jgi:hypothetical protein
MGVNPYSPNSNLAGAPFSEKDQSRHPQSFAPLFDLNRQTIALLVDISATPLSDRIWPGWRTLGNELGRLDATRREDLARCPFALIDAALHEAPRCSQVDRAEPHQGELPFSPILLQTRLDHLAHAAWLLAWHLVRTDVIAARLVFAMDSASTSLMTQVTLTDIRRIAHEQVRNGRVRPRWHNQPDIWSRLMHTARSSQRDTFANVTTRGLQLFLQELLVDEHRITERSS